MNVQVKQRLVGASVLVSLAVIFIPILLPGGGSDSTAIRGSNVPPVPDYRFPPTPEPPAAPARAEAPSVPVDEPAEDEPPAAEPASAVAETKVESKTEIKTEVKPAAAPKPQHTPKPTVADTVPKTTQAEAWVVQVGSFSSNDNAKALRDKLRKLGYTSFVEAVKGQDGMVYRVRVGPELTRKSAEQLSQRLSKDAEVKGLVQSYP